MVVRLQEGGQANFSVLREGLADFVATVMYRVDYGEASPGDLTMPSEDMLLVYDVGEWVKNISVAVEDDNIPETDEPFTIVLYNATGGFNASFETSGWHRVVLYGIRIFSVSGNIVGVISSYMLVP